MNQTGNTGQTGKAARERVLSRDELRQIAEIGFAACGARNSQDAQRIFGGLLVLAPEQSFAYIGLALSRMCVGDADAAVHILREQGLRAHPDDDDLQVILGVALLEAKRQTESRRVLTALLAKDKPDAPERRLARALLAPPEGLVPSSAMPRPATAKVKRNYY